MAERYIDLPLIARRFLETLNDEKVRAITVAADVIGDMDADMLALLRKPKPELVRYLAGLRVEEIERLQEVSEIREKELQNLRTLFELRDEDLTVLIEGIDVVRSLQRTWKIVKIVIGTAFGAFITMAVAGEKLKAMLLWLI